MINFEQRKKKIFLIDDMEVNLRIYKKGLGDLSELYEFHAFQNPNEAYEALTTISPDIIVSDLEMPYLNGIDLCKKIKLNKQFEHIPFLILTSAEDNATIENCYRAGAIDFITKPVNLLALHLRIENYLKNSFLKQELDDINKRVKNEANDKQMLIRILSHDLMNTFAILKAVHHQLERFSDIPEAQQTLEKMLSSIDNAVELVNHVRDMSAMSDGKYELKLSETSIFLALKNAILFLEDRFKAKEIKLSSSIIKDEFKTMADMTVLSNQIFANLISNAIKFSPRGSVIEIRHKVIKNYLLITIKDKGDGIPESIRTDIFNPYVKTSRPGTEKEKGTGFGLPIVKTYVNLLEGDIDFETKTKEESDDTGTSFTLMFKII